MILTPDNEYAVVLDACVLVPMPLCDTLLRLAEEPGLYRPLWSEKILQEVSDALGKLGYNPQQRDRRLQRMRTAFPEAIIDVPREIEGALTDLPHQKDCHVVAVAIIRNANAIVTQNKKHFPPECLQKYGILCHSPDDFLIHQYHLAGPRVLDQLDYQAANIKQDRASLLRELGKIAPDFAKLILTGGIV
ncbi:MAG: putative toxin-antitoxin system toxin component, PIN family [Terriglobia bacterium]